VIALVQSSASTSFLNGDEDKFLNTLSKLNLDDDGDGGKNGKREHVSGGPPRMDKEKYGPTKVAHVTKLCASFARTTTLLTGLGQDDGAQRPIPWFTCRFTTTS
jgi:hypothetical protein